MPGCSLAPAALQVAVRVPDDGLADAERALQGLWTHLSAVQGADDQVDNAQVELLLVGLVHSSALLLLLHLCWGGNMEEHE